MEREKNIQKRNTNTTNAYWFYMIIYQAHTNGIAHTRSPNIVLEVAFIGGWLISGSLCIPLRDVQLYTHYISNTICHRHTGRLVRVRSRAHNPASVSQIYEYIYAIVSISYSYIYYKQTAQCTFSNHQHPYIINTKSALNWIALLRNQHNHINNFAALVCAVVRAHTQTHTRTLTARPNSYILIWQPEPRYATI